MKIKMEEAEWYPKSSQKLQYIEATIEKKGWPPMGLREKKNSQTGGPKAREKISFQGAIP